MNERDGADSAMEEAARLQIELDALHAKAHRIQLRHEAAEAKLQKVREECAVPTFGMARKILAILDGEQP